MKLFVEQDLIIVNGMLITRDTEKLLNNVANKGAPKNLTSSIISGKKVPYIQGLFKNYLRSTKSPNISDWGSYLDKYFMSNLGIDLKKACNELGKELMSWLEYPSSLPDPGQLEDPRRVGADREDKNIISNSVKYYNLSIADCEDWIKILLVDRNFEGGIAQFLMIPELQKYIEKLGYSNNVRLSTDEEDKYGIDLVADIKNHKSKLYQVKKISYKSSYSIKKSYGQSYTQKNNMLYYGINENHDYYLREIVNNDSHAPIITYP